MIVAVLRGNDQSSRILFYWSSTHKKKKKKLGLAGCTSVMLIVRRLTVYFVFAVPYSSPKRHYSWKRIEKKSSSSSSRDSVRFDRGTNDIIIGLTGWSASNGGDHKHEWWIELTRTDWAQSVIWPLTEYYFYYHWMLGKWWRPGSVATFLGHQLAVDIDGWLANSGPYSTLST